MAQFGGGFPGGGGMRGGRGGGGDRSAAREQQRPATAGSRVDMLEQTIEELRVLLKLLSAQMPAWESYTGKVRALAGDIGRSRSQMPAGPETSVLQRIDRSVDAARNRLTRLENELTPNAIEVYISRLRSKLDPAGIRIRTVRGFGYMLEEFKG
jgi:hypothetical protein